MRRPFTWVVTGTDAPTALSFAANDPPRASVDGFGMPYTAIHRTASDIADELGPAKVVEIGLWDPTAQTAVRWCWTGTAWAGTDFLIDPGTGICVIAASSFA